MRDFIYEKLGRYYNDAGYLITRLKENAIPGINLIKIVKVNQRHKETLNV